MVVKAAKFTPEVLLGAPRRSAGVPNPSSTYVLFTVSTYSFDKHAKTTELRVLVVKSGESHVLAKDDDISDINWLDDDEYVCLQSEKDGTTSLYWSSVAECLKKVELGRSHYIAGKISGPASNLRVKRIGESKFAVVISAEVSADGQLHNPNNAKSLRSTGKLYDTLYVRHWDRYETKEKNALWYGSLKKNEEKYSLSKLTNALDRTPLECPIRPFGGTDHFDISHNRIVFVCRDPALVPALSTKNCLYFLTIDDWEQPPTSLEEIKVGGGAKSSPVFSPDGTSAAFLSMAIDGYESDQNRIYVIKDVSVASTAAVLSKDQNEFWDLSPQSLRWTTDNQALLAVAEDQGYTKLFYLPLDSTGSVKPSVLTQHGSVSDVHALQDNKAFISGSSLIDNSYYAIVDLGSQQKDSFIWTNSNTADGKKFGLLKDQVSSIWTPANNPEINTHVHSWVIKPSGFDKTKTYPVAYLIHGGPQGSWTDTWSTRWNPAVFAEQGYIVIAINPTGSTGYGQKFTDAINKNWGGDPYEDIVKVFDWVGENMPEADNDRAVALGGSYGGYMVNWIQGHDLGRKFKALVNHDGIFALVMSLATDELYFPFFDQGGTPFYDPHGKQEQFKTTTFSDWRKWDPSEHLSNWSTPELVIHSAKDYRLSLSEGLATYNVLQARKVPSQFLTFPDENHWVLKPENSLVWHKTVLNWINKHVGLDPYSSDDPNQDAYFGGVKEEETSADMPTQGKPET